MPEEPIAEEKMRGRIVAAKVFSKSKCAKSAGIHDFPHIPQPNPPATRAV
jgi:hypothetical protein